MKVLYCDVCKNAVSKPISDRSYYHFGDFDICESCKENLDKAMRGTLRSKAPFNYSWYSDLTVSLLRDGQQKGKIEVKQRR
jgi:hypothetical protein